MPAALVRPGNLPFFHRVGYMQDKAPFLPTEPLEVHIEAADIRIRGVLVGLG